MLLHHMFVQIAKKYESKLAFVRSNDRSEPDVWKDADSHTHIVRKNEEI